MRATNMVTSSPPQVRPTPAADWTCDICIADVREDPIEKVAVLRQDWTGQGHPSPPPPSVQYEHPGRGICVFLEPQYAQAGPQELLFGFTQLIFVQATSFCVVFLFEVFLAIRHISLEPFLLRWE